MLEKRCRNTSFYLKNVIFQGEKVDQKLTRFDNYAIIKSYWN